MSSSTKVFDPSTLKCEIGFHRDETKLVSVDFEFIYAIGTTEQVSMFELEQLLYTSIDESLLFEASLNLGESREIPLPPWRHTHTL